ncbi:TetR family transcriptional regulator-like protein [Burkholderia pseudomallei]|nr:TetR family transcriptional regulator-like protein [Burkholderia pseudomallei]CAJ4234957.1 TetR family transcriptional regulator-like protein [Burkholderia pseudomallei]CAK0569237.1 TetR family transcriptional regulator-like protein [Burkholderia pseudomallei]
MTQQRKTGVLREKELKLAIFRIERGRAHSGSTKLSISSVAREAGITAALIHNHYPAIAELIRTKQGASSREQRDAKHNELVGERRKNAQLRRELQEERSNVAKLGSINEMLQMENDKLKAMLNGDNVVVLKPKNS